MRKTNLTRHLLALVLPLAASLFPLTTQADTHALCVHHGVHVDALTTSGGTLAEHWRCTLCDAYGADAAFNTPFSVNLASVLKGEGTPAAPFEVSSAADIYAIAVASAITSGDAVPATFDRNFILTQDLTITGTYLPIGYQKRVLGGTVNGAFSHSRPELQGSFDGNYHTVTFDNATVDPMADYCGFLGGTNGLKCTSNVIVSHLTVRGTLADNGHCEAAGGITATSRTASIVDCRNFLNLNLATKCNYAGGIVGSANATNVASCANYGNITINSTSAYYMRVGGILGYSPVECTVSDCFNAGDVTVTSSQTSSSAIAKACGIDASEYDVVLNCCNVGTVKAFANGTASATALGIGGKQTTNAYNGGAVAAGGSTKLVARAITTTAATVSDCYYSCDDLPAGQTTAGVTFVDLTPDAIDAAVEVLNDNVESIGGVSGRWMRTASMHPGFGRWNGDFNNDGALTASDVTAISSVVAGAAVNSHWGADVNADGKVSIVDVAAAIANSQH